VREAERDTVFQEYAHREKEVLNATVKRIEGQDVIYDLGRLKLAAPSANNRVSSSSPSASACGCSA